MSSAPVEPSVDGLSDKAPVKAAGHGASVTLPVGGPITIDGVTVDPRSYSVRPAVW
jgi:hypothetical protein